MKININPYFQTQGTEVKKAEKGQRPQEVERTAEQARAPKEERTDRVELRGSQMMERARARVREMPEVREERVEALRKEIEAGTYNVAPSEVARAMLSDLLKDIF